MKPKIDIRTQTYNDLLKKLTKYGRCAIIRPTGFGKTWMLTNLIQSGLFNNILYLYPAEVVKNTVVDKYFNDMRNEKQKEFEEMSNDANVDASGYECDTETAELFLEIERMREAAQIKGVDLMTYSKLIRLDLKQIEEMRYDLIIIDECHRVGAFKTKIAISKLFAYNPNAKFVGATATPNRMDAFDVVNTFFNDICTFEYNLHDAFTDGLIRRPYYCYCTYDAETDLKEEALCIGEDIKDEETMEILKKKLIEISNIYNMENVIKDVCDRFAPNTSYMKFIVFFSTMNHMHEKMKDVKNWFHKAYPKHAIRSLIISSENKDTSQNVNELHSLTEQENTIDLICCIDMLNMGYHVNDITGILMYRGTSSDIIFLQQLGRAFSSGAENSSIVFDIVDNLHRKAVYDMIDHKRVPNRLRKTNTTKSVGWHIAENGTIVDKDGDLAPVQYKDGAILDNQGNKTNFAIDGDGNVVDYPSYKSPEFKQNCNRILPIDLIATGNEATYRELVAKAVAEPMSQRCKQVVELHFKKWCKVHGFPYPITNEELKRLSGLTREDFRREFEYIVKSNKLDYPIHDAARLLALGEQDGMVPMRLFARLKNVQIAKILELLGL